MVGKMKKIFILIILLLIPNLVFSETKLDDYVSEEFDKSKSGTAQFVKTPKNAAKDFIRSKGFKIGLNKKSDGSSFFLSIGQGSVSVTDDVQSIHDARFNGFREAIQNAKAEMVKFLGESVKTSLSASVKENTMPEKIPEETMKKAVGPDSSEFDKLKKLIGLKLDRALKDEGYDPNADNEDKKKVIEKVIRSREIESFFTATAQQMISGFQAWTVFEESNPGDKSQITVVGIWSPKLSKLASAIKFGSVEVPKGVPKKPIREQLPINDAEKLLQSFGAQMYVNENGKLVLVSYGHASPLFEDRADALVTACDQAHNKAKQNIVLFVNENIVYQIMQNEIDKAEDFEKEGMNLYRSMQGREYNKFIESKGGLKSLKSEELDEFAIKSPRFGATDCVAIRYWSPELETASADAKKLITDSLSGVSSSSSTSASGNTEGKDATQGTTGSSDF